MSEEDILKLVNETYNQLEHCYLPKTFRHHFSRWMGNAAHSHNNERIIYTAFEVQDDIKAFMPLAKNDIIFLDQYVYAELFDYIMPFNTLHDVVYKHGLDELFNIVEDLKINAIKICVNIKNHYLQNGISLTKLSTIAPFVFYSPNEAALSQLRGYVLANHASKQVAKIVIPSIYNKGKLKRICFILNKLNNIMNAYLTKDKIIESTKHGYHLTKHGHTYIAPYRFKKFIYNNVQYQPKRINRGMNKIIRHLSWVDHHRGYRKFFGLDLLLNIIDYHSYQEINRYKNKYGPSDFLGLTMATYTSLIINILNTYFHANPNEIDNIMNQLLKINIMID